MNIYDAQQDQTSLLGLSLGGESKDQALTSRLPSLAQMAPAPPAIELAKRLSLPTDRSSFEGGSAAPQNGSAAATAAEGD